MLVLELPEQSVPIVLWETCDGNSRGPGDRSDTRYRRKTLGYGK